MTDYPPAGQRITRSGKTLSARVWALLDDVADQLMVRLEVAQGSWSGAAASAGTHDGGGAVDLRVVGLSDRQQLDVVDQLRRRNGCAWLRSPAYGWTSTGPHIHCIVRDEPGLSSGARQQVSDYDRGRNGLANNGPDPFARPPQHPFVYPPKQTPPTPSGDPSMFLATVTLNGKTTVWLVSASGMVNVPSAMPWTGARATVTDPQTWDRMVKAWPQVR